MARILSFIFFITLVFLVYFSLHYAVFAIITNGLALAASARKLLSLALLGLGLLFPLNILFSRLLNVHFLNYPSYVWMGIVSIAFTVSILLLIPMLCFPGSGRLFTKLALVLISGAVLFSLYNGLRQPQVRQVDIPLKRMPRAMSGFRLVQISDLHLEGYKSRRFVSRLVTQVNQLQPDLVVFTGDLVDGSLKEGAGFFGQLARIRARFGLVAVTGNHEYYSGLSDFLDLAGSHGIRVLQNEMILLGEGLQIVGVNDRESSRFPPGKSDLEAAFSRVNTDLPVVFLNHQPLDFEEACGKGTGLQLSGHTHAGQIPPLDLIVHLLFKYPAGLVEENGSYIYTSCGTGYWGPPMRLFSRPEVVLFQLHSPTRADYP